MLFTVPLIEAVSGSVTLVADYRETVGALFDEIEAAEPHGVLEARLGGAASRRRVDTPWVSLQPRVVLARPRAFCAATRR